MDWSDVSIADISLQGLYNTSNVIVPQPVEPRLEFVPRLGQVHFSGPPDSSIRTDDGDDDAKLDESNKLPPLNDRRLQSTNHLGQPNMVEEEICFGMIHNTRAQMLGGLGLPSGVSGERVGPMEICHLGHQFQDDCILLTSPSEASFAVLNEEVTGILHKLANFPSSTLETYMNLENWNDLTKEFAKNQKVVFNVDIVLYGSRDLRDRVANLLSAARIYLQHPCHQKYDTIYDNPHFLKFGNLRANSTNSAAPLADNLVPSLGGLASFEIKETTDNQLKDQVHQKMDTVYNSLTRSNNLVRLKVDARVTTRLLPHQEEGLHFMAQREYGPTPKEFCLWEEPANKHCSYYQHMITKERVSEPPTETIGGILADDMGLGKTLMVISTILRTLDDARFFSENRTLGSISGIDQDVSCRVYSKATLVIVPSPLLIDEWLEEIGRHCDGSLNTIKYHGRGRVMDPATLAESDIVLSTYHTVATEIDDCDSPLFKIMWFRVVLDEAHMVRNGSTKLFRAVSILEARFRWCLTGTPVQNRLEDLAALVSFIRAEPLNQLFEFRKYIINPLLKGTEEGARNIRILLDSVCIRRTKRLLHLPEAIDEDRIIDFSMEERQMYNTTLADKIKLVQQNDSHERNEKGYFGVFQLHLQLRRLCNHGTFQKTLAQFPDPEATVDPNQVLEHLQEEGKAECVYCNLEITGLEGKHRGNFTVCGHLICSSCLPLFEKAIQQDNKPTTHCPLCQEKITQNYLVREQNASVAARKYQKINRFIEYGISSKVSTLLQDIKNWEDDGKSIIFSCWTRTLDLVAHYLELEQIQYTRIDGSLSLKQRHTILEQYHSNKNIRILLMTTGTGSVGLNLTIANRVYILEPQWNPMVESQAIARVLRLGQRKNVKVVRYIVSETVEVGMRSQQTRKLDMTKLGWKQEEL